MDIEDILAIEESSVTVRGARHRTTVPIRIFRYLKLKNKDRLKWVLTRDNKITITKIEY